MIILTTDDLYNTAQAYYTDIIGNTANWTQLVIKKAPMVDEGKCEWFRDINYVVITLNEELSPELLEWVLIHELYELLLWRDAQMIIDTLSYLSDSLTMFALIIETWKSERNSFIERMVSKFLGKERPDVQRTTDSFNS